MWLFKDKAFCLQKLFGFDVESMNVRTEILAGITTFLTMSYILAVNPEILGQAGMTKGLYLQRRLCLLLLRRW